MLLISTRNSANILDPLSAVLKGIADDGGLYVPSSFPVLSEDMIEGMKGKSYQRIAADVLGMYFEIDDDKLARMTEDAYSGFSAKEVVPITELNDREYVMELYHGPTLAFKDVALQLLPRLMSEAISASDQAEDVMILTATSGDTGKAALEGFKNVPRTKICVFYPEEGVSDMQRLQMVTTEGNNTYVAAIKGNFDDAQTAVKQVFTDAECNKKINESGYVFSSANSINFGRLAPQIVYYIYGYVRLLEVGRIKYGDKMNVCVPTGNFGNILAAYYAKRMGLPIGKFICASNQNNVLTDFFDSGTYYSKRQFFRTISPSMDILISSNLERLVFEALSRDSVSTAALMKELKQTGAYNLKDATRVGLNGDFYADFCDDNATLDTIRRVFNKYNYVMDTHTAVGQAALEKYLAHTDDPNPILLASTASPFKFASDVLKAISGETVEDAFEASERLANVSGLSIPRQITELNWKQVRFKDVCERTEIDKAVFKFAEQ